MNTTLGTILSRETAAPADASAALGFIVPIGRVLLSLVFIFAAFGHFSRQTIDMAAGQGVPLAGLAVPLSGIMSLVGGLSILLGYRGRLGAAILVAFLVPVTLMMHKFWATPDPMWAQLHLVLFLKNLGLLGGALFIAYWGAGPFSLDARSAARRA